MTQLEHLLAEVLEKLLDGLDQESSSGEPAPRSMYVRTKIRAAQDALKEFDQQLQQEKNSVTY